MTFTPLLVRYLSFLWWCLSQLILHLLAYRISFQPVNINLQRDPASKTLLLFLIMTSVSKSSYLRYTSYLPIFLSSYDEETITTPFQEVENTLFQVLRNGFNVSGTPFEAMFALPQTQSDNIEGSSLENPIHLLGIKVDHFRSFLRILHPLCVLITLSVKYSHVYE